MSLAGEGAKPHGKAGKEHSESADADESGDQQEIERSYGTQFHVAWLCTVPVIGTPRLTEQ